MLKDKVRPLTIYVKESAIKKAGGADYCREQLTNYFNGINLFKGDF